jgi:hypothetical protein
VRASWTRRTTRPSSERNWGRGETDRWATDTSRPNPLTAPLPIGGFREKKEPDAWTTFNTKSLLGGALLGRKKCADAEPLLMAGYAGMMQ